LVPWWFDLFSSLMIRDISALSAVRDFAARLAQGSWFAACGEKLTESEIDDARGWMAALGLAVAGIDGVATWQEAATLSRRADWSRDWWEAEESERKSLHARAASRLGEEPLLDALSAVARKATDTLHGAAALATARSGVADQALSRVAAGAASQACHQAALALAAEAGPGHGFAAKHRLFAGGRWGLGVVGGRCFVF
jgi:hypothetical protein